MSQMQSPPTNDPDDKRTGKVPIAMNAGKARAGAGKACAQPRPARVSRTEPTRQPAAGQATTPHRQHARKHHEERWQREDHAPHRSNSRRASASLGIACRVGTPGSHHQIDDRGYDIRNETQPKAARSASLIDVMTAAPPPTSQAAQHADRPADRASSAQMAAAQEPSRTEMSLPQHRANAAHGTERGLFAVRQVL